jgi:hypothetical protein
MQVLGRAIVRFSGTEGRMSRRKSKAPSSARDCVACGGDCAPDHGVIGVAHWPAGRRYVGKPENSYRFAHRRSGISV